MTGIAVEKKPPLRFLLQKKLTVILLGPPGSGKGTHAPTLGAHFKIPHISTGDLFRDNIRAKTPIGERAQWFMDQGKLVPDEVVLDMLFSRLSNPDCKRGAILDGVPRTVAQAESLERSLGDMDSLLVLLLKIDPILLVERICGRLACSQCGKIYHTKYGPPQQKGVCDACQKPLWQRSDDTEEVLEKRLSVYRDQTEPLARYYQAKPGVLREINGDQGKDKVFDDMLKELTPFCKT